MHHPAHHTPPPIDSEILADTAFLVFIICAILLCVGFS